MEPEPGPCLGAPTSTNVPTVPHYCCRQSLMSSRVSETMQLLQMALPSHLPPILSIYRRWETCQWPTSLQRERKRSVMESIAIWSQNSPQTHLKAWEWWNTSKSAFKSNLVGLILMSVSILMSVLSFEAGHIGQGKDKPQCVQRV